MNGNILLHMLVNPLLVVFITASHRDLSWGQGYILSLSTTFRIVLEILEMSINLYADDTTLSLIGERLDTVFAALNIIVDNVLQWSKNNQLTIHPLAIKTETMLMRKSSFIAPLPPLSFWSGTICVLQSTTCLGVKPDCRLSWSEHVSQVRKSFAQKCFKRMKYFPVKTLQETSFKIIIPSLSYCIKSGKTVLKPFFLLWTWYIREQREVFLTSIRLMLMSFELSLTLYFFFLYWKSLSLYSGTRFILIPCLFELMN